MSFTRATAAAFAALLALGLATGTAQAGEREDREQYRAYKQHTLRVANELAAEAKAELIAHGSPSRTSAFFDRILTEVLGAPAPPTPVSLPPACAAAVQPVRNAMAKYTSMFDMPSKEWAKLVNKRLGAARLGCGESTVAWANFYANEFEPWYQSKRSRYDINMTGDTLTLSPKMPKRLAAYGSACQKLSFNADGWLERTSCRK